MCCYYCRSRNDSLNILVDLLPPDAPSSNRDNTLITVDINRHKEIIVKAISATLLLLLKHFKVCVCVCVGVLCVWGGGLCVCEVGWVGRLCPDQVALEDLLPATN